MTQDLLGINLVSATRLISLWCKNKHLPENKYLERKILLSHIKVIFDRRKLTFLLVYNKFNGSFSVFVSTTFTVTETSKWTYSFCRIFRENPVYTNHNKCQPWTNFSNHVRFHCFRSQVLYLGKFHPKNSNYLVKLKFVT